MKTLSHLLTLLVLALLCACQSRPVEPAGHQLALRHATLLTIEEADSFTRVTVGDAWHEGKTLATYILVDRSRPLPTRHPEGTIVRTPIERMTVTSAVHASLLQELGAGRNITGLTDTAYIISPEVKALLQQGARSMGTALQPDLERLKAAQTDAVLVSPMENAGHGAFDRLGVPLIECADYMESSPLGRAEWMRFYGRLVGRAAEADSLFARVERSYQALTRKVDSTKGKRPTVFCDLLTGATWYQPGGHSTMGRLITDAGGRYLWADRPERGSLSLNLETVFVKARSADIWLIKYGNATDLTYSSLAADNRAYRRFRAWRKERIFACNTLHKPFYEATPFHPERLLQDFVTIFHPEATDSVRPQWYTPLTR